MENHLKPHLGDKKLSQLTAKDIQRFYEKLAKEGRTDGQGGLSSGTIRGIHGILHSALRAAQQAQLTAANPTEAAIPPKLDRTPQKVLTDEQLEQFMETIQKDALWHDFFYTEMTTGLRRGEICGLMWEDFDEANGVLNVQRTIQRGTGSALTAGDTKTYAGTRKIVLPPSTAALLSARKASALTEWIFPDPLRPERPTNPNSAYHRLKSLLKQAGLPSIRFHDLRHIFATNALEHGMDVKTLSTIIGHVSSATTMNVYAHVSDSMKRSAAIKIDRSIAKGEPSETISQAKDSQTMTDFTPQRGKHRYWGSGFLGQVKSGRWTGRYTVKWPDGRKETRSVYANTEDECEKLLAEMISQMKMEVAAQKDLLKNKARAS